MSERAKSSELGHDLGDRGAAAGTGYRVLARKYRPATFAELIGQDAMVRTISNAFESGRIPQAWILTGVRGVRQTTTARASPARALNSTNCRRLDDRAQHHHADDGRALPSHHRAGTCLSSEWTLDLLMAQC